MPSSADHHHQQLQLAVAPPISATPVRFKLPRGWGVRRVIRRDGSREDRYFVEPGTGKQFRSIKEVQRHLSGQPYHSTRRMISYYNDGGYRRSLVSREKSDFTIVASVNTGVMEPCSALPDGWFVEDVPRRYNESHIDKYYYEAATGRKFRSLIAVHRYLAEMEENAPLSQAFELIRENKPLSKFFKLENQRKAAGFRRRPVSGEKRELAIVPSGNAYHLASCPALPDGWLVEEVPRRHHKSWIDRYYYEPGTGRKFRSLLAAQRYLSEMEEDDPSPQPSEDENENQPLPEVCKAEEPKKPTTAKNDVSGQNKQESSFVSPPIKVEWVLDNTRGDSWSPYISETLVPDLVKKQWTSRFDIFMKDEIEKSETCSPFS